MHKGCGYYDQMYHSHLMWMLDMMVRGHSVSRPVADGMHLKKWDVAPNEGDNVVPSE